VFVRPEWTLVFCDHNVMISFHVMKSRHILRMDDLGGNRNRKPNTVIGQKQCQFVEDSVGATVRLTTHPVIQYVFLLGSLGTRRQLTQTEKPVPCFEMNFCRVRLG
jgi:hypothetical protein